MEDFEHSRETRWLARILFPTGDLIARGGLASQLKSGTSPETPCSETVVWKMKLKASEHPRRLFGVSTISPSQPLTFGAVSIEYHLPPLTYRPLTLKMKLPWALLNLPDARE